MPRPGTGTTPPEVSTARPKCGAKKAGSPGQVCRLAAGHGTNHPGYGPCKYHMGNTPMVARRAARDFGADIARTMGHPVDITPSEALLEEVRRSAGTVRWLEEKVGVWKLEDGENIALPDELAGWLQAYREERKHLAKVAKAALDAGVAERAVRVAEQQGEALAGAIQSILAAIGLTPEQKRMIPQVVPPILRALSERTDGK